MKKSYDKNLAFGKRLRDLRLKKGLSATEAAKRIGVAISTYREWENGRAITGQVYIEMGTTFGVSLDHLFGLEEKLSPEQYIQEIKRNIELLESFFKKRKSSPASD